MAVTVAVADPTPALTDSETAVDFIRRLLSAWECCATCAGGVLKERDTRIKAEAVAAARAPVERLADDLAGPWPSTSTDYARGYAAAMRDAAEDVRAALAEGEGGERGSTCGCGVWVGPARLPHQCKTEVERRG